MLPATPAVGPKHQNTELDSSSARAQRNYGLGSAMALMGG